MYKQRSQMYREAQRRRWAHRKEVKVIPKPTNECLVSYGNPDDIETVTPGENGTLLCTCRVRSDPSRCRHIVAVELFLGIYHNPYQADWEKQQKMHAKRQAVH